MRMLLIVKAKTAEEADQYTINMLGKHGLLIDLTRGMKRLGSYIVEIDLDQVIGVYKWFNECSSDAPFPDGTLLWFQVTP